MKQAHRKLKTQIEREIAALEAGTWNISEPLTEIGHRTVHELLEEIERLERGMKILKDYQRAYERMAKKDREACTCKAKAP